VGYAHYHIWKIYIYELRQTTSEGIPLKLKTRRTWTTDEPWQKLKRNLNFTPICLQVRHILPSTEKS